MKLNVNLNNVVNKCLNLTISNKMIDSDDLVTAVEPNRPFEIQRALQIRIKQSYNCPELPILTLRAPFLGFSAFVRFQSRARIHAVSILNKEEVDRVLKQASA